VKTRRSFTLALVAILLSPIVANAETVTVGAKEWMKPIDTVNNSWFDIANVCDEITGACTGNLGTVDLTGWTWASIEDVAAMFAELTPHPGDIDGQVFEQDSAWAPAFLSMFGSTWSDYGYSLVRGITRTTSPYASDSYLAGEVDDAPEGEFDEAYTTSTGDKSLAFNEVGGWFYASNDNDNDGVRDADDRCENTVIPESAPTSGTLGQGRYALTQADSFIFAKGQKTKGRYDTTDTAGCSCEQIVAALGLGRGQTKFGCSKSVMEAWILGLQ
jgi:hypothetical protein